jgi:hypothetical protein
MLCHDEDDKAFIFSLSNQTKFPIKNDKKGNACYANKDRLFSFGGDILQVLF